MTPWGLGSASSRAGPLGWIIGNPPSGSGRFRRAGAAGSVLLRCSPGHRPTPRSRLTARLLPMPVSGWAPDCSVAVKKSGGVAIRTRGQREALRPCITRLSSGGWSRVASIQLRPRERRGPHVVSPPQLRGAMWGRPCCGSRWEARAPSLPCRPPPRHETQVRVHSIGGARAATRCGFRGYWRGVHLRRGRQLRGTPCATMPTIYILP